MPLAEPPQAAGSLGGCPSAPLAGRTLHRMWRRAGPDGEPRPDPWWFASTAPGTEDEVVGGRFDLVAPMGTCYLATTRVGAALEALQDLLVCLPLEELEARRMADIHVAQGAPVAADLTAQTLTGTVGMTASVWAGGERALTQRWAAGFRRDGWWALHAGLQHDPSGGLRGVAVFDHAGAHSPTHGGGWAVTASDAHADGDLHRELAQGFGVTARNIGELPAAELPE